VTPAARLRSRADAVKTTLNLDPVVKAKLARIATLRGVCLSRAIEELVLAQEPWVNLSIPTDLLDALTTTAAASGQSVPDIILDTLRAAFPTPENR
jgi:hypothetical protein